jgi:predicted RecA/RadA family phage recombinase
MILDERAEFLDATTLNAGAAGTYLIGDVYDLQTARDIGVGQPLYFAITVDTAAAGGSGQFQLVSDAQAAIATDGSATVHFSTGVFTAAQMTAGKVLAAVALPQEGPVYERFLGVLQITSVAALTAGKVNAFLTPDFAKIKHYADAVN